MKTVLLINTPEGVRREIEKEVAKGKCNLAVALTEETGMRQIGEIHPDIVLFNARGFDGDHYEDPRAVAFSIVNRPGMTAVAVSQFSYERTVFEKLGCEFCRPEQVGETVRRMLSPEN